MIPQHNLSEKFDISAQKTNGNMRNIREKENMCQYAFFPCVQGIRMRRSEREEQKTDV